MKNYIGLAAGVLGARLVSAIATSVVDLTSSNFDAFVSDHAVVMVEFYAPWCEICKELEPVYEHAASLLHTSKDIRFARVNCVEDVEICEKYFTPIYPTLRLFQGLDQETIYHGEREPDDMVSFAEVRTRPSVQVLTKDNILGFAKSADVSVMAFWDGADVSSNATFTKVAEEYLDFYKFGATSDPDVARIFGLSAHGLALHKTYDQREMYHHGSFEVDVLADFITTNSIPLVAEYEKRWSWCYPSKNGVPLVAMFAETVEERKRLAKIVRPVATRLRDSFRFVTVDAATNDRMAAKFLLGEHEKRAIVIRDAESQIFRLASSTEVTEQSIGDWIDDFHNGKLQPTTKMQVVAANVSEEHVVVLDNENFDAVVLDESHDVLVEFYAPWCGHCQKLVPAYAELAERFAQSGHNVRIAKMDATVHKVDGHPITSYPTIKFFPAYAKGAPVAYDGDRSVVDMAGFVEKNAGKFVPSQNTTTEHQASIGIHDNDRITLGGVTAASHGESTNRDEL